MSGMQRPQSDLRLTVAIPSINHEWELFRGTLVAVFGCGLIIQGVSGSGKSELALGLIDRGHTLIADDVVLIDPQAQTSLVGYAPEELQGRLQVHGCGLFDMTTLYGRASWHHSHEIHLALQLAPECRYEADPLTAQRDSLLVGSGVIPRFILPLPTPRNLPLLAELLTRQYLATAT